jgi:plastocyanin
MNQIREVVNRYLAGKIDRRQALKLIGALGIGAGAAAVTRGVSVSAHQEAAATPVIGPREDGTNLWKVQVGGMDMANAIDTHAFYPSEITINAGDSIFFAFAPMGMPGFHTVTFTSGGELPPLFVPDLVDGTPVASPEGPPRLLINPALLFPDGRESYDGTGLVNSGFDVVRMDQGPYQLTFTTPGTYEYVCAAHSIVMKGTVTVQEAGAELPYDPAAYEAMAQEQFAAVVAEGVTAIAELESAVATPAADGASVWDVAAGAGGLSQARVMRFLPQEVTIKAGDIVRWTNLSIGEPHTVTFLGGEEQPEDTLVEPQEGGPPKFIQNYRTLLPAGDAVFDGTGYTNSGFMGLPPEIGDALGLPGDVYELAFTVPGEYPYYCILHAGGPEAEGGMIGKVIVEA